MRSEAILEVRDLTVRMDTVNGPIYPVNGISFNLKPGSTMGIVGESGSGKSTTAYAIMHLLNPSAETSGEILFRNENILKYSEKQMDTLRGSSIGIIFQEPVKYLDPSFQIGTFLTEVLRCHKKMSRKEAKQASYEMMKRVGFSEPERVLKSYPSELSGGMCQRVMIAMILLLSPQIIIADEPTTALDVTIQDGIVDLLKRICSEENKPMMFITHNFGLVAELCEEVCVMYGGSIMEAGKTEHIFASPSHPYTRGLLNAIPSVEYEGKQIFHPIEGKPVDLTDIPAGCAFAPRCPHCKDVCLQKKPEKTVLANGTEVFCWLYGKQVNPDE